VSESIKKKVADDWWSSPREWIEKILESMGDEQSKTSLSESEIFDGYSNSRKDGS